ncbi:right-handed parallel beta-helix repeat-containing protein [Evansella sp. AB-rgal1]|uniref:right-handed parallel beta-helix repeat-containing protein n=1 Tax=Evansella sp. AB-rgal1 TaxID=3242696 RepID=UPI00359E8EA3
MKRICRIPFKLLLIFALVFSSFGMISINNGKAMSTQMYEAEDAPVLHKAGVYNNHAGYTGTGFVDYVPNEPGGYIEWVVNAPSSGTYTLDFRYAHGKTDDRPGEVLVNGNVVESSLPFPSTGAWNNWEISSLTAELNGGSNTVRLIGIGNEGGVNIDHLKLTGESEAPPSDPEPTEPVTSIFTDNFVGATSNNLFTTDYMALPNDPSKPMYIRTGGTVTVHSGSIILGGGRMTIGAESNTSSTSSSSPGGVLDLSEPYQIKLNVVSAGGSSGQKFQVYVDNNTTGQANSIHGSASKVYEITANELSTGELVLDLDIGTSHSFIQLRTESGANVSIDSVNIVRPSDADPTEPAPPSVPSGLVALAEDGKVTLSWNAVSSAHSYNVKRSTSSGGSYSVVATVSNTSYTNTSLTNGTTYYYVVSAVNSNGESNNSTQVSATPQVLSIPEIPEGDRTFYLSPNGSNNNSGTESAPFATLNHAVSIAQPGDVFVLRGGTYYHDNRININRSGNSSKPITIVAYPGEIPTFNFWQQPEQPGQDGIRLNGNYWHIIGVHLTGAGGNGFRIHGSHNILERSVAYENRLTGIHLEDGSYNLIKNNDSFRNFNTRGRVGNMADGFAAKYEALGPGNVFYGNRAWENSDDGFDFWMASSTILLENNWSFGNGNPSIWNHPDFDGGGNGFKLGGNHIAGNHIVTRNIAFDNHGKGFDHNNNRGALTLTHNTGYNNGIRINGRNFDFPNNPQNGQHVFKNNLSAEGRVANRFASNSILEGNSWQIGTVTPGMFFSVDTSLAKEPRQPDGSLPDIDLFVPRPNSFLVNGGVNIGEPYNGTAPDIGAIEYSGN